MHTPSVHPAIYDTIAVARTLDDTRFQQLIAALEREQPSLSMRVLHIQHLLHFSTTEAKSIVSLLRRWQAWGKDIQALIAALLAARATCTIMQAEAPSVRLVWTGPVSLPGTIRTTSSVLIDIIDHAQQEIIVVGYTLAPTARQIIVRLAQAQQRGIQIVLIVDRMDEKKQLNVLHQCWPPGQDWPLLYTREATPADEKSALHAKAVIVDSHTLLTTSANLSYHGLAGNIELGLLAEGSVAQDAVMLLKELIAAKVCVKVAMEEEM
jgi:phosphatidylserine/phosphatidylglycerophosphate/cardiolipin synthase-like enzyme